MECRSYANVIQELGKSYKIVQLGTNKEPLLNNVIDGRSLTIKESANLLAHAQFFIGQVGFLNALGTSGTDPISHYIRRKEKAWQSGYPCNENIETHPECSLVGKTTVVTSVEHVWRKLKRLM